jgi:hypothetical protein
VELDILAENFSHGHSYEETKEKAVETIKDNLRILQNTHAVASSIFIGTLERTRPSSIYYPNRQNDIFPGDQVYSSFNVSNFALSSTSYSASRLLALQHNRLQEELVNEGIMAKDYATKREVDNLYFFDKTDEDMLPTNFSFAKTLVSKNRKVAQGEILLHADENKERLKESFKAEIEHDDSLLKTE